MKLWTAPTDVLDLARSVILEAHPHLEEEEIVYLFRSPAPQKDGRDCFGQAAKATARERAMVHPVPRFVITLSAHHWTKFSEATQRAVLDHYLSGCGIEADDEGHPQAEIVPPDFAEYGGVLKRHGAWWRAVGIDGGRECVVAACRQLDLFKAVEQPAERSVTLSTASGKSVTITQESMQRLARRAMGADL